MESKPQAPPPLILRRLINIDTAVSLHLHNLTQSILPRSFLKSLEISGDGRLFFPILLSLLLSPLSSTSPLLRAFLLNLLIGALLDLLVIGLIKHLVRRPRPVYNKHMSLAFAVDHWSFPSGHSSRVCFIASFFYLSSSSIPNLMAQLRCLGFQFADKWIGLLHLEKIEGVNFLILIVCVWAITTSVSRVLLGRHFVFDVVAGALFGVFEGLVVFHFLNCSLLSLILQ